jgi:hypothetical protein
MAEQTERCVCCGANLRASCNEAHPQHDTYHPDGHTRPQPDWRDVIRAMRSAGFSLEKSEGYPWESYWSIETDDSDQLGSIVRTTVLDKVEWKVSVWGGTGAWEGVTLADPSPADLLTAAHLVGLVGAS